MRITLDIGDTAELEALASDAIQDHRLPRQEAGRLLQRAIHIALRNGAGPDTAGWPTFTTEPHEDGYIGLCEQYPNLSHVAATEAEAVAGIINLVADLDSEKLRELEALFDLRWDADSRAIARWRAAAPGREAIWPDHADLVVWLLEHLEASTPNQQGQG